MAITLQRTFTDLETCREAFLGGAGFGRRLTQLGRDDRQRLRVLRRDGLSGPGSTDTIRALAPCVDQGAQENCCMKTLFDPANAAELKSRLGKLNPDAQRQWGTMTAAQAVAHCAIGMQMATGELRPPRSLLGRFLGWAVKPLALRNDDPFKRNSPTDSALKVGDERDFDAERDRLNAAMDRVAAMGRAGCTDYPHPFFGRLTPDQWGILMYKHIDHHLRQFGA